MHTTLVEYAYSVVCMHTTSYCSKVNFSRPLGPVSSIVTSWNPRSAPRRHRRYSLVYLGKTPIEPQKTLHRKKKKKGEERQIPPSSPALYLFSTVESISLSLSLSLSLSVNFSLYLSHARSELDNGSTPPALRRSIRAGVVRGLPPHCCLLGDGRCDQDVLRS